MPSTEQSAPSGQRAGIRPRWLHFARHYLEMVLVMLVGMLVLGAAFRTVLATAGVTYSMASLPELVILEMGLTMALAMAAWMRYRGHRWASTLEMSGAMLGPALAVIPLVWLGVLDAGAAMTLEHVAMFLLMLAVMLRRRDEYATSHRRRDPAALPTRGSAGRRLAGGLVALLAFLLVPAGAFAAGLTTYERSRYTPPEATAAALAAVAAATPPAHDPSKPTAVIVVGNRGANIADTLAPHEVLVASGAFNVYTVAPERRLVPLLGGLDLVPDLSFAQLQQRLGGSAPDVTVVPDMPRSESSDAIVTGWLREHANGGLVLGVCTGARLLAEAGLLDGRDATSHWFRIGNLQERHPDVNWQRGIRYLDDGDVITTGGLLSSVDGTLRVVERLAGAGAAATAAEAVGWRHYTPDSAATLPQSQLAVGDALLHILNVGFRANQTTVGVVLTDGVGELELAAAFDPYAEIRAARTVAIAAGDQIRSRHGLTFVPRAHLDTMGHIDRLVIPGAEVATNPPPEVVAAVERAGVPVAYLHGDPGFAFDPALQELARTMDVPTSRWAAKILEYPSSDLKLSGPGWPWTPTLRPLLLGLIGLAAALAIMRRTRHVHHRHSGQRFRDPTNPDRPTLHV